MSTKFTPQEEAKLDLVEHGSMGHLKGVDRQKYELNKLCWRMAYEHQNDGCWACTYVEGQRS